MKFYCQIEDRGLNDLIDAVMAECKQKLQKKFDENYCGWDMYGHKEHFYIDLIEHAEKGDWIDVINYAAFLWNFEQYNAGLLPKKR